MKVKGIDGMNFLREHWFDIGIVLAIVVGISLILTHATGFSLLLWLSLITLFLHQFEEYRFPGYFPGVINQALFSSQQPDRYPLNTQTALIINVVVGWLMYVLAAVLNQSAVWLGIATILVSLGNVFAHTVLFNVKGKTVYNPGMLTAILLFLPLTIIFFIQVTQLHLVTLSDWILGIVLGIVLNYVGIIKMIDWMKNEQTPYIFPARCLLPNSSK